MVLKRGVTKNVLVQGVWPVYMGIGIATKKGGAEKKGVEKERGYDRRRNFLLVKLIRISFT